MKLTHTIEGEGSDVLLLHGFPSNIYFWDEIKKELIKNNKRVTVPEQRGYPLSEIKDSLVSDFNIEYLAIDIAENILKLLPKKTHEYDLFLSPTQLQTLSQKYKLSLLNVQGIKYNPVIKSFKLSKVDLVNYFSTLKN